MDSFNTRLDDALKKRARELARLTSLLRSALPPEIDGHYHVANIRDRTLVIMTDSPVWTTRLRQLGPMILDIVNRSSQTALLHIRVFSRPAPAQDVRPAAPRPPASPEPISARSGRLIAQTASSIEDDGLRHALLKLAGHASVGRKPDDT